MDESTPKKRCTRCAVEYPATTEFFYKRGNGLISHCVNCARLRSQMYKHGNRERVRKTYRERHDRLKNDPGYKRKNAARAKTWRERNPDKAREASREYGRANRVKRTAYERKWRILNHNKYITARRAWIDNHRENIQLIKKKYRHKRRAWLRNSVSFFTQRDIRNQFRVQKGLCWWCGDPLISYHIDHRIPLSRGGSNDADNIVLSCAHCNTSRGNKMPWEWSDRLL